MSGDRRAQVPGAAGETLMEGKPSVRPAGQAPSTGQVGAPATAAAGEGSAGAGAGAPQSDSAEDAFDSLLKDAFRLPEAPVTGEMVEVKRCPRCGANLRGDFSRCPADGTLLEVAEDPRIGLILAGHYRLLERLGSGGIGTVYRGRHRLIGRDVAVKFLRSELAHDPEQRARLLREAQTIGRLEHPHIASVIDFIQHGDDEVALVMEYVRGRTLAKAIAGGRFDPARAVHVARQIAGALARAHDLDVLHRDIKPSNIVLCRVDTDPDFVKLLDFGIARVDDGGRLTSSGVIMGTPHYMAPEQARGEALGPASDLYALGCVLFEMLTGSPPFDGLPFEVIQHHARMPPPHPRGYFDDIPEELDALVVRLLQKAPRARFHDAHHLIEALDAVATALPLETGDQSLSAPSPDPGFEPGVADQLERHWNERLALLTRDAAALGLGPESPIEATLARGRRGLERLHAWHAQMRKEAEQMVARDTQHRTEIQRIARALDGLGRDESLLSRELQSLELTTAAAVVTHARALDELCNATTDGLTAASVEPEALDGLLASAHTLKARTRELRALRRARVELLGRRDDLRFQAEQLKGRLAMIQAEHRTDAEASHLKMGALDARALGESEEIAQTLDEIASELRARAED